MKTRIIALALTFCMAISLSACGEKDKASGGNGKVTKRGKISSKEVQFAVPNTAVTVTITTELGDITAVLYPEYAPQAVENFLGLIGQDYYKDMTFHRVINDFVIQTGDSTGTGTGGSTIWKGAPFAVEVSDKLHHYSGALAMAHPDGKPLENTSQFYIVTTPQNSVDDTTAQKLTDAGVRKEVVDTYKTAGGAPYLDGLYTVFGQVTSGMDIVDKIAAGATEGEAPTTPIKLVDIKAN